MVEQNSNKRFSFLNQLDIDQDVKSRLSIHLARTYEGSNEVYQTPIAKEYGANKLLSEWDKVFQEHKSNMNSDLLNIEETQRSKFGPLSIAKPWSERKEGTLAYFEVNNIDYSTLDATPQATRDKGTLRPISIANASNYLKNSTNSGLPFYTRKGNIKTRLLERFKLYLERKDPAILFTRTTEQRKTRDIWGFPVADTLNEMTYYRPLLDYQRKLHWRSALNGPDAVNQKMTHIIKEAMLSKETDLISIDFSSYDRSIKEGLQQRIKEYYKYLYQGRNHQDIDYITDRKYSIGLLTPDGVIKGSHGIPSGSTFTNEDDSIAQFIISRKSGTTIRDLFDIQGDDGAYACKRKDVKRLFGTFNEYGVNVNDDKTFVKDNQLVYLQNLYHIDYMKNGIIGGIYPVYRALNRILYQERWSNFEDFNIVGKDFYSIRTLSILENSKHHPLFKELVKFVLKYDKYGLKPSQQGIRDYVKMIKETSGTEGILFNQYGDNITGINRFESVKLVRELG